MTLATLPEVLGPALRGRYAVAGLVCQGWEDSRAYVEAAEAEGTAVILQAGPGARAHTPLSVLAAMLRQLAERAAVPVVVHLDHGRDLAECWAALDAGFTSVMFDGSLMPLADNIAATAAVAALAHAAGASCEGEVGVVGYAGGAASEGTNPAEAGRFAREAGVDALAVSAGNVHLQATGAGWLDLARLRAIEAVTGGLPLVLHGGSGLPDDQRLAVAGTAVCKVNVGTELRRAFGAALREALADPARFDRIEIMAATHPALVAAARRAIRSLRSPP